MWCSSDMNTLGREVLLFGKKDAIRPYSQTKMYFAYAFLNSKCLTLLIVFVVYLPKILKTKFEVSFMKLFLTIFCFFDLEQNFTKIPTS